MQIYSFRQEQPTPEEIEELDKYIIAIERVVFYGKISVQEIETLNPIFNSGRRRSVSTIYEKLQLYRYSIIEKIANGELQYY